MTMMEIMSKNVIIIKLDKFFKKVRNFQNPTLLFYGDSIIVDANASGFLNKKPFTLI